MDMARPTAMFVLLLSSFASGDKCCMKTCAIVTGAAACRMVAGHLRSMLSKGMQVDISSVTSDSKYAVTDVGCQCCVVTCAFVAYLRQCKELEVRTNGAFTTDRTDTTSETTMARSTTATPTSTTVPTTTEYHTTPSSTSDQQTVVTTENATQLVTSSTTDVAPTFVTTDNATQLVTCSTTDVAPTVVTTENATQLITSSTTDVSPTVVTTENVTQLVTSSTTDVAPTVVTTENSTQLVTSSTTDVAPTAVTTDNATQLVTSSTTDVASTVVTTENATQLVTSSTTDFATTSNSVIATTASPEFTVIVCENVKLLISCTNGTELAILEANYGRTDPTTCPSPHNSNTNCKAANSLTLTSGLCDGKESCTLDASNKVFGDPCHGTKKYMDVKYSCVPA